MKMIGAILASLLALTTAAEAQQPAGLITNIGGRQRISLNGRWQIIIDPYETGYYDYRYEPRSDGYFLNAKPRDPGDLVEYDFDSSQQLNVPGDWNSQDDRLLFYEGTIWYKKSFDYQTKPGTRVFVHCGAANYLADVYLNGRKLGRHEGGFTPFDFEITGLVHEKDNFLVFKVDDKRRRDAVPTLNTDWWNYGGLTRDVTLVEVPDTFVEDYFLQLKKGSMDEVAGWVKVNGGHGRQQVIVEIPEAHATQTVTTDDKGYAAIGFRAQLQLWSPDNPRLYRVTLSMAGTSLADRIGFRTVETKGADILLNGRPVFLRGISIHGESPLRGGRAFGEDDARQLLTWAKELGCNFVRLAHYPHDEQMTRLADEMGIMVWSEIPVYWTVLWDNAATFENARNQLTENITRDRNRASIILWSVANETPVGAARTAFLKGLIDQARALDPTRLLTAANERRYADATTQIVDDPLGEYLDVLGCNEYVGWYDGPPEKADGLTWKVPSNKPLVISEFGGDARFGLHGDKHTRWTEEYQQDVYEHQIAMLKKIPSLRGMSPWILTDFRSPRRPLPGIQDFYNRKGLISNRGERKAAFFVLQRFYRELAQKETPGRLAPQAKAPFAHTDHKQIVDASGRPLVLHATNLGNWLVPEGYMWLFQGGPQSPGEIRALVSELLGPEGSSAFWQTYRENYVTHEDVALLHRAGFNAIRVPMHYSLFESDDAEGFRLLDRLIAWSRAESLYVILDLHAAPGGQTGTNIDDSTGYPWLFQSPEEQEHLIAIWRRLAARYRDEPAVLGYDLLNEPIPPFPALQPLNASLEPLYRRVSDEIRTVDPHHILFLGGAQWDGNFAIFGKPFDTNVAYTFHKYWTAPDESVLRPYLAFRDRYDVPIWMGESGENTDEWIAQFRNALEQNGIGWAFWPFKKLDKSSAVVSVTPPADWGAIVAFAKLPRGTAHAEERLKARPGQSTIARAFAELLENVRLQRCRVNEGYLKALGLNVP